MKDIVISRRRQRIELWTLAACFVAANIVNICAIHTYDAPVSELYTSIFYVLVFTAVLYAVVLVVRLLIYGISRLIPRKKQQTETK